MITVTTPANSTRLTTVERAMQALGVTSVTDAQLDLLNMLVDQVSNDVADYCGRVFVREGVTESVMGWQRTTLMLSRTPLVSVSDVRYRGASVSGWSIYNPAAGFLFKLDAFITTQAVRVGIVPSLPNMAGAEDWVADYVGGYLTRNDDLTASGAVTASGNTYALTNPEQTWPYLVAGDYITVTGFASYVNNRKHKVVSRSDTEVVVAETLVTEAPSGICTFYVRNLPDGIELAVIDIVKRRYQATDRDLNVKSEHIGDWSTTYIDEAKDTYGFTAMDCGRLNRYARIE